MSYLNGVSISLQIHVMADVPGLQSMVFVVGDIGGKVAKGTTVILLLKSQ